MKVFISHSSADKWMARRIAQDLEALGATTFLDEKDIETGESIDDSINKQLKSCDELLMLLSPQALKSHWVLIEIGGAKALDKRLVPILIHLAANELPNFLSKHLARDINDIDRYYTEVSERLATPARSGRARAANRRAEEPRPSVPSLFFEEGELVRIANRPQTLAEREKLDIDWTDDMDVFCGEAAYITFVDDDESVRLDIDDGENWWAFEWLRPVGIESTADVRPGDIVRHRSFGFGRVQDIQGNNICVVEFDTVGAKRLALGAAPIKLVSRSED